MSTVRKRLSWGIVVAGLRDICTLAVDAMLRLGGMSRCIVIHRRERKGRGSFNLRGSKRSGTLRRHETAATNTRVRARDCSVCSSGSLTAFQRGASDARKIAL